MKKYLAAASFVIVLLLTLGTLLGIRSGARARDGFRSGVFDPPREAPDFELDGSTGSRLRLRDFRGKVVILEFGFTFCTQVCPITLSSLVQVHEKLGPAASDVQLVFVTVDPKRDNAARLQAYLSAIHPRFVGATGRPDELQTVRDAFGIMAKEVVFPNEESGYDHSSFIYLLDRQGKIRALVPFGTAPDDIVHDIQLLLRQ